MSLAVAVLLAGCGAGTVAREEVAATANGSMRIPELVRRIAPAVVHISTEDVTADQFGRAVPTGGVGTGFIVDAEGHVVTNAHVVAESTSIRVTLTDGCDSEAELVGADGLTDLAVLKIDLDGLTIAPLGPSMELEVGETVVAMGDALDLPGGPTATVGVASALDRTLTDVGPGGATLSDLIQTDASINPATAAGRCWTWRDGWWGSVRPESPVRTTWSLRSASTAPGRSSPS